MTVSQEHLKVDVEVKPCSMRERAKRHIAYLKEQGHSDEKINRYIGGFDGTDE